MAVEIKLRGFAGAPVGTDLRKFANDQRLDVRLLGLFIIEVRADISDVGVSEADDLPGVAWVGEYFLISGEAGIKNDFAAPARDGAGRAAIKYAPVFQRENRRSMRNFRQCVLLNASGDIVRSFCFCFRSRGHGKRPEVIDRPIGKHRAAIDEPAGDGAEYTRIIRADAVIAHYKITFAWHAHRSEIAQILVLCRHVRLRERGAIHIYDSLANLDDLTGQADHALDKRFCAIQGIPEDDHVAALDGLEAINKLVDEDALLVGEQRRHAGTFDFHGLIEKDNDDQGQADGDQQVAGPNTNFVA